MMGKYITMTVKSQGTDGELTQGFNAKARCTPERDTGESGPGRIFFFPFIIFIVKYIVCCPLIGSQLDKRCNSTKRAHRGGSWSRALLRQGRSLALP